jgi:outer membrane protein assembly factor BamB
VLVLSLVVGVLSTVPSASSASSVVQETAPLPRGPLTFGAFVGSFAPDGSLSIEGEGWPEIGGDYELVGDELTVVMAQGEGVPPGCERPGRYRYVVDGEHLSLRLLEDPCQPRSMILGASDWRPVGEPLSLPERKIVVQRRAGTVAIPAPSDARGSWPSFRGAQASGVSDGMGLPDSFDGESGDNVLWRVEIPGLAHSSPVIWGERLFLTSAVSSRDGATFRPGLYGDGDAADDRSRHSFVVLALDKNSGEVLWRQVAAEAEPRDKRHIKATYANPSPVTDGRIVVASFGSQGLFAYTVTGEPLWQADLGRLNLGAYDVPSYEWGPASSPILWQGRVIVQCDTQDDSFVVAFDGSTGEVLWKSERDELPTWGTPTVVAAESGPELVTNGARFIRGYDPRNGDELWRLGGSSKITAPTPIAGDGFIVVASGRAPERPIFVLRPGGRGDISLEKGQSSNATVVWSQQRRGPYMPTPLIYRGLLYVLANNGVFDAYELATGREIYRQRLEHGGSGFSASPVAADGKIYLAGEDGEVLVLAAGEQFRQISVNHLGEPVMATPALSEGRMYVRGSSQLFAIGAAAPDDR